MAKWFDKFGKLAPNVNLSTMGNLHCKWLLQRRMSISLLHSQYCNNTPSDGAEHCLFHQDSHSSSIPAITVEDVPISVELFCQLKLMVVHQFFICYYY